MTVKEKNSILRELERYSYQEYKNGTVLVHFDDVYKTLQKEVDKTKAEDGNPTITPTPRREPRRL